MKTENTISHRDFWSLPEVKKQQDIQKANPFRSKAHVDAFYVLKKLCAELMGEAFADDYFGEYE
jgi:hypothetical protein